MDYKTIIGEIHKRQLKTFCLLENFQHKKHLQFLPRKHRGLYWIWSNLTFEQLQKLPTRPNTMEVPISKLVNQRKNLKNICIQEENGFTILYNGVGGYKNEPAAFGLRERLLQEFNCMDGRTGTLNILNRQNEFNNINNWAISYFDFDDSRNFEIMGNIPCNHSYYLENAKTIETNWRIEFGTPILTRY